MPVPPAILYYVHDPMCSWCYGFKPVWLQVVASLKPHVDAGDVIIRTILGGLAPDTDQPMPAEMQANIRDNWNRIRQEIPGSVFNDAFWTQCQPRRSTYPACRAVIAAGMQRPSAAEAMTEAIQQAYYRQARNPSDDELLLQLGAEIGLDVERFKLDFYSPACADVFQQHRQLARDLGVSSYPSIVINCNESNALIYIDYNNSKPMVDSITRVLASTNC